MAYDLNLTFTGLCVLLLEGGTPTNPNKASVALTEASHHGGHHKHVPRLVYRAQDLVPGGSSSQRHHALVADAHGNDLAVLDLRGDVMVEDPTGGGFHGSWDQSGPEPAPGEEKSLAWLPSIYEINQSEGIPQADINKPHQGLTGIVATIELEGGHLEAGDLTRDEYGQYVQFEFVYEDLSGGGGDNQVLADKLHLRLTGLTTPISIAGNGWIAQLEPQGSPNLDVSITNLPVVPSPPTTGYRLDHFDHYYDMFYWTASQPRPPRLRLPKRAGGGVTGSSGVCPPSRYG